MPAFSFKKNPFFKALRSLADRFQEDRLGLTASSLTFTTVLALVPLVTVVLALFTAFPVFSQVEATLQHWLLTSLVPDSIVKPVMGAITQFSAKASGLGLAGFAAFTVTVLSLVMTIDGTLNAIWRVQHARSWGKRVLVYWAVLTLGPLLLAFTLFATTSVLGWTKGWGAELGLSLPSSLQGLGGLSGLHGGASVSASAGTANASSQWWLDPLSILLLSGGMACLFKYVPNTYVRWRDAWAGGFFVGLGLELAKNILGYYLLKVPTYSLIYGAFAAVPILLVWIYVAWMVVLLGAEFAAYLPFLLQPEKPRLKSQAWPLELALTLLQALQAVRQTPQKGLTSTELTTRFDLDLGQLELVTERLRELDWVATLNETDDVVGAQRHQEPRWVILVDPSQVPLGPLLEALLFKPEGALAPVWHLAGWDEDKTTLAQALLPSSKT